MPDQSDFDPAILKPSWTTDGGCNLKAGCTTDQYAGGIPGPGDLKPSLLDADGNLKPGLLDADGNLKPSLLRDVPLSCWDDSSSSGDDSSSSSGDDSSSSSGDDSSSSSSDDSSSSSGDDSSSSSSSGDDSSSSSSGDDSSSSSGDDSSSSGDDSSSSSSSSGDGLKFEMLLSVGPVPPEILGCYFAAGMTAGKTRYENASGAAFYWDAIESKWVCEYFGFYWRTSPYGFPDDPPLSVYLSGESGYSGTFIYTAATVGCEDSSGDDSSSSSSSSSGVTALIVTGELTPDVTGVYDESGEANGYPRYDNPSLGAEISVDYFDGVLTWRVLYYGGMPVSQWRGPSVPGYGPIAEYVAYSNASGTATVTEA